MDSRSIVTRFVCLLAALTALARPAGAEDAAGPASPPPGAQVQPAAAAPSPTPDAEEEGAPEAPPSRAGVTGICGLVVEAGAREPLVEAQVRVVKGGGGAVRTDVDGRYVLALPPGDYEIRAFYELHQPRRVAGIAVRAGECTAVDLALAADTEALEEVVVEARPDARREAATLAERKKAVSVSDAVSAQEISRTPDASAADAAKRVVSVTVVDGKRVFLRGLGGRYSAVLLDGVPLPSPDADEHTVPLDLFPTSLLANLTVVKTYTPDLPGGFAGGALRIETTPYPTAFEAKLKVTTGGVGAVTLEDVPAYRGGSLDLVGFDDGGRKLPAAVPTSGPVLSPGHVSAEEQERIGESFENNWARRTRTSLPSMGFAATVGDTLSLGGRTGGYVATVGYRLQESARTGQVGKLKKEGDVWVQRELLSSAEAGSSANLSALVQGGIDLSRGHRLSLLGLYTHTGETRTSSAQGYSDSDAQVIDTSRLQFTSRGLLFGQLSGRHALPVGSLEVAWQANASLTTRDEPDTRDAVHFVVPEGRRFKEGPGSGTRFFAELRDVAGGAGVHVTRAWGESRLRGGATVQASDRRFEARRFRFLTVPTNDPDEQLRLAALRLLPMEQMLDPANIGPAFYLEEETFQTDAYDASLAVYAGYLAGDWAATSRLRVSAGVRYEVAVQELTPGSRYATEDTLLPGSTDRTDGDVLPAVNATFALRPDMDLRAGYSFTLGRPQFRELAPFIYFDFSRRRSVTGDPDLETTRIHNLDARWEWFTGEDEVLAATLFYKRFDDPIEAAVVSAAQGDLQYVNAPEATAIGAELEARLPLRRLASALRPFRAAANVALIRSRVDFGGERRLQTSDRRPMQGQSPFVVNAAFTWAAPFRTELTVLYNVSGRRVAEVGFDGLPDTYEQPFHRVDLTLSGRLAPSWKLKAALTNLLDDEVVLKQDDLVVLRHRPGLAGSIALEWSR